VLRCKRDRLGFIAWVGKHWKLSLYRKQTRRVITYALLFEKHRMRRGWRKE